MENKETKVEVNTTKKELTILDRPLFIGADQYDPKEVCKFALKQAGLWTDDPKNRKYTNLELTYIINTCKEKGLNPMKGEISFFKAKSGMLQAIPKYTTQLELLWREFRKDNDFLTFNVYIDRDNETQEWRATAKADYINPNGIKYSHEISLYSSDWKCSNGMVRFMLQKQSTLQFIRLYYPHIDLGYDIDELQTFDSGIKQNKPIDHKLVDIEVKPMTMECLSKEIK